MSQTPDEYKFFTETKVSQGKSVDGKLSLQVELPKGRHIFFTEIKKPIMSGKPIPFACELKYLFSPFKSNTYFDGRSQNWNFHQREKKL